MTGHSSAPDNSSVAEHRLERLRRDYLVAFLRYLPRRAEVGLAAGYELGRSALAAGVSTIDLVRIHHDVLTEVLLSDHGESEPGAAEESTGRIVGLAADFLSEVIAAADMVQRSVLEPPVPDQSPPGDQPRT